MQCQKVWYLSHPIPILLAEKSFWMLYTTVLGAMIGLQLLVLEALGEYLALNYRSTLVITLQYNISGVVKFATFTQSHYFLPDIINYFAGMLT